MDILNLTHVASACSGELRGGNGEVPVRRVIIDSRLARQGDLFVALKGDKNDGHDFLVEAARRGASAVLAARDRLPAGFDACPAIVVDEPRQALGMFASHYRAGFAYPFVAVGGSNGKTTTKELVASVLRQKLSTVSNESSFNNDIGVPLTLLRADSSHEVAVVEVGTNHPGELHPLLDMVRPRIGVITSIGREHLEFFGDLDGVVKEEGAIGECLPEDGVLILNGDSEWAAGLARRTRARVVKVGERDGNDWRAREVRLDAQGAAFHVDSPKADFTGDYRVNLLGRHQVTNALLAIVVGEELGLGRAGIQRGLTSCKPARMRMQLWEASGIRVLEDCYNANADSTLAALRTLADLPCEGRRIAVVGDMLELGAHAEKAHEEIGRAAAQLGVGQLFAVGTMAAAIARGARSAGLMRVMEFSEVESAAQGIQRFFKTGDLVLLKASRANRLERVADGLRAGESRKVECSTT